VADEELVPRDEARASLEARRELGPEYEADLVERFAERVESRLAGRAPAGIDHRQKTAIVIVSIIAAIPLVAIAAGSGGLAEVVAVCAALVAVNFFVLRR
jgi:hypothetical protein